MHIEELLDAHLAKENAIPRKRSGKYSPSSFQQCFRRQYWNRKDEPKTNPPDARALRIFKIGKITHEYLQALIPHNKEVCEKQYSDDNFTGFADHVGPDYVEDFKTVGSYKFKLINGKDADITVNSRDYIIQLMAYCLWFDKPIGKLTFINKDDWKIKTFEFKLEDYRDKLKEEMGTLMGYWNKQELPPDKPRLYKGRECVYCAFRKKCGK